MKPELTAGVDEVGRGPLAGDVVAAAVILDRHNPIEGLTDSKKLSQRKREILFEQIMQRALCVSVGRASVAEIDRINILQASFLAMQRAVSGLSIQPQRVLVDGNKSPEFGVPSQAIVKGDLTEPAISAASIIAKVTRDQEMIEADLIYPGYGFAKHKGYPTKQHLEALQSLGLTDIHRRSYAPVQRALEL